MRTCIKYTPDWLACQLNYQKIPLDALFKQRTLAAFRAYRIHNGRSIPVDENANEPMRPICIWPLLLLYRRIFFGIVKDMASPKGIDVT